MIRALASSDRGLASLDLTFDDATHRIELPVGVYYYHIFREGKNCSARIVVKGTFQACHELSLGVTSQVLRLRASN